MKSKIDIIDSLATLDRPLFSHVTHMVCDCSKTTLYTKNCPLLVCCPQSRTFKIPHSAAAHWHFLFNHQQAAPATSRSRNPHDWPPTKIHKYIYKFPPPPQPPVPHPVSESKQAKNRRNLSQLSINQSIFLSFGAGNDSRWTGLGGGYSMAVDGWVDSDFCVTQSTTTGWLSPRPPSK